MQWHETTAELFPADCLRRDVSRALTASMPPAACNLHTAIALVSMMKNMGTKAS